MPLAVLLLELLALELLELLELLVLELLELLVPVSSVLDPQPSSPASTPAHDRVHQRIARARPKVEIRSGRI
ncbi:MAG TPA: hypothetical protein VMU40_16100 [Steroidobacteraceae bacterium]|nr:hypothetical protein [Steroidobacteraceae bacterium]